MNLRLLVALALLTSVVGVAGCKSLLKKRDPEPAPSAAPVVIPPAVVAPLPTTPPVAEPVAPAPVAVDETAVPASQDFEDEAFEKVTTANFRAQFTQLKTDISKP